MSSIVIGVNNPYGTASAILSPPGGFWSAKTISCKIIAWQTAAETDVDEAGFNHATEAILNGVSIATNDEIQISFSPPTLPYDHLAFYYQTASSWDSANPAKKCSASFSPDFTLITIGNDDDSATITFGTTNDVTFSLVSLVKPQVRQNAIRAFNGLMIKQSYAFDALNDSLEVTVHTGGTIGGDYNDALDWIKYATQLLLVDSANSIGTPYISQYTGKLINTTSLASPGKNTEYEFTLTFMVDSEST